MAIEKIKILWAVLELMVADYLFDVKNIDIWAPAFFKHNNLFIATMKLLFFYLQKKVDHYDLVKFKKLRRMFKREQRKIVIP